ncbi:tetratricopeptide repeat protein [Saccharothrix saharensis]|uniref:tetratricopeptide repeat protein n=1 Tax=Saccharothrix saharensis TaxID=571190 RepID=UPI0036C19E25
MTEDPVRTALAAARRLGDRAGEAEVLGALGNALRQIGQADTAMTCLREALPLFRRLGDRVGFGEALNRLGEVYRQTGRLTWALRCHLWARDLFTAAGVTKSEVSALHNLATVHRLRRDFDRAVALHREAAALSGEAGMPLLEGLPSTTSASPTANWRRTSRRPTGRPGGTRRPRRATGKRCASSSARPVSTRSARRCATSSRTAWTPSWPPCRTAPRPAEIGVAARPIGGRAIGRCDTARIRDAEHVGPAVRNPARIRRNGMFERLSPPRRSTSPRTHRRSSDHDSPANPGFAEWTSDSRRAPDGAGHPLGAMPLTIGEAIRICSQ